MPKSFARPVVLSRNSEAGPALGDVVNILKENDIHVESKIFEVLDVIFFYLLEPQFIQLPLLFLKTMKEAREWSEGQKKPVVLLHHEDVNAKRTHRMLANSSDPYMPLTEEDISSYQVCSRLFCHARRVTLSSNGFLQIFYWVFFVFLSLLMTGVLSIFSMEVIPDSLLFAKFQSSRTGKAD